IFGRIAIKRKPPLRTILLPLPCNLMKPLFGVQGRLSSGRLETMSQQSQRSLRRLTWTQHFDIRTRFGRSCGNCSEMTPAADQTLKRPLNYRSEVDFKARAAMKRSLLFARFPQNLG